jgi:hypothetical protein
MNSTSRLIPASMTRAEFKSTCGTKCGTDPKLYPHHTEFIA